MFRMGRRRVAVFWLTVSPVLAALWGLYLKSVGQELWSRYTFLFLAGLCLASFLVAYYNNLKPVHDLEGAVVSALTIASEPLMARAKRDGLNPRLNVLLVRRPWRKWFTRHFVIVWGVGMENQPDVNVIFPISRGAAGEALRTKTPRLANTEENPTEAWGFTAEEIGRFNFRQLRAIYSWPIYEVDARGNQTGRVIGTVNLDARATGAADKITAKSATYDKLLAGLAAIVSRIAS